MTSTRGSGREYSAHEGSTNSIDWCALAGMSKLDASVVVCRCRDLCVCVCNDSIAINHRQF